MAKKQKIDKEEPTEPAPVIAPKAAPEKPHTVSMKIPKLPKTDKHRLPRRQKKAQKKAAGTPA